MKLTFILGLILISVLAVQSGRRFSAKVKRQAKWIGEKIRKYTPCTDLILVLDSSGSVTSAGFDNIKSASKLLVKHINDRHRITPSCTRVGVIKFSETALTVDTLVLGAINNWLDIKNHLNGLTFDNGGRTNIKKALLLARLQFLNNPSQTNNGLIWMLTDGDYNVGGNPVPMANWLKAQGKIICIIAIGPNPKTTVINQMATPQCVCPFQSLLLYKKAMQFAYLQRNQV